MSRPSHRIAVGDRVVIYPRGKRGFYTAEFHYDGQHRRLSLRTTRKKEAMNKALELGVQIANRTYQAAAPNGAPVNAQVTLATARAEFLDSKRSDSKRPKTIAKYDGILRNFERFCETSRITRVAQVSLRQIDAFRRLRKEQDRVSPAQMYHDIQTLKLFFGWCAERQLTAASPLAAQKCFRPRLKRKDRVLTLEQVNAILEAAPRRIRPVLAVLAFTGMRSGNARHLLVEDVELDRDWIQVRSREGAESKVGNEWSVPIHPRLKRILEDAPKRSAGFFFTAPPSRRYPRGDRWINTKRLNEDFLKALKTLGIPAGRRGGFTIHDLRHFFKSFCVSHGVPREYVDVWQGHASVNTSSDLYLHQYADASQRFMSQVPF